MRKFARLAAAAAVLACTPALAGSVTGNVVSVDTAARTVTLGDQTVMIIAPEVDLSGVKPGQKVTIIAKEDDNGFSPATAINPVQ